MKSTSSSSLRRSFATTFPRVSVLGVTLLPTIATPELAHAQTSETTTAAEVATTQVAAPEVAAPELASPAPVAELPKTLPYLDGVPPPPGYVLEHRTWHAMWITGAGLFVGGWLPTAMGSGDGNGQVAIPIVGPFLGPPPDADDVSVLRVALSALQVTGIGMIVAGLVIDNPRYVRADLAGLRVTPVFTGRDVGAHVSVAF